MRRPWKALPVLSCIMAANDYYYGSQRPPANDSPSPAPHYNSAYAPSPSSTPAPSYHSGYPAPGPSHAYGQRQQQTGPSPFDTVFDDNAYPICFSHSVTHADDNANARSDANRDLIAFPNRAAGANPDDH